MADVREERPPRIVIIGGGFGGLMVARKLAHLDVRITVLDRTNHHVFQPLLYQVATASLAPSDITAAIRHVLRKQQNTEVDLAEALEIDVKARIVKCMDPTGMRPDFEVPYDYLVVASGTRHSYFGHPEWEPLAPGLKTIEDATEIRRRFLVAFEEAERASNPEERDAWLTFVIVGAGPTGCELAGVMQEIAFGMRNDFRRVDTRDTSVILLEAGPRILPAFPEKLAARAASDLKQLRVDVRTASAVTRIQPGAVYVGDHRINSRAVFWAAGNVASPLSRSLGVPLTKTGQVIIERDLSIPGHPNVFVIGDLAHALQKNGVPAPGVAQVAMQEGRVAARNIAATISRAPRTDFDYFNKGDLATIGRGRAIASLFGGRVQLGGRLAWLMWLGIHITYLIGFRNRLSVMIQWAYAYFTYQRGARLITETPRSSVVRR
ncbi:MAG: NAD(P)/FAD-dependent oxidoreductase [Gemmatimonadota bacterium]|nr:NAD(P)/FAD-dependent oxidoreductase [Gemmatimonadota bacterium]